MKETPKLARLIFPKAIHDLESRAARLKEENYKLKREIVKLERQIKTGPLPSPFWSMHHWDIVYGETDNET